MLGWINTHKKTAFAIFATAFFLILGSFFLFQNLKNRFSPVKQKTETALDNPLTPGSGSIKLISSKTGYSPTELVDLKAVAGSGGIPVTAFDVVIEFDPEFFSLANKKSEKLSDFIYFPKTSNNTLRVSGIQKESSTTDQIFNETELFDLTFLPKKTGKTQFKMIYSPNSTNDSNLITREGKDILGNAGGVEVEIR